MKKYRIICLILCLVMLLQLAGMPVRADETDGTEPAESTTQQTEAASENKVAVPEVPVGSVSITSGCRTIEGQMPLGGTEKMLQTAQSAFIFETTTQTVIYAYCPDIRLAPGSLSKIMTALIAIEEGNLDDVVTVSTHEISQLPKEAITLPFKSGEQVTVRDLLHALILESANDAALLIAEYIDGNETAFVERMNQRVLEMDCDNTYFTNCHGLDDPQQYTTARDMAKITWIATQNPEFEALFGATSYTIQSIYEQEEADEVAKDKRRSGLASGNYLIYDLYLPQFNDNRVTGGMPSFVSAASGASISFTAQADNMNYVMVLMGCNRTMEDNGWKVKYYGNFNEALDILEYTFNGYTINRLLYEGQTLRQFTVSNAENDVVACSGVAMDTVLPKEARMANLSLRYSVNDGGLSAPIQRDERIGTVQLWYNSCCVAEAPLYAKNEVRPFGNSGLEIFGATRDDSDVGGVLKFLGVVLLVVLVPVAGYLIYNHLRRQMARARRRRRRASRRRSR